MSEFDYKFECDSLGPELLKSQNSFFWCITCKSLEDSIDQDLNLLKISSDSFIKQNDEINNVVSDITATPTNELNDKMNDLQGRVNSKVPNLSDPVQISGANQSSYNSYFNDMIGLSDSLSVDTLTRIGLGAIDNYVGQQFPISFLGKSDSAANECLENLISSYDCDEMNVTLSMLNLLDVFKNISDFVNSLMDAINGYVSIGCNPEKGLEFEANANSSLSQLPLDSEYNLDPTQMINDYDTSQEVKDNIQLVNDTIGPTIEDTKDRLNNI